MSTTDSDERFSIPWRDLSAILLVLGGLALIALSVVWPFVSSGKSAWSDEKALAYQSASAELHSLSMRAAATPPEDQTRAMHDKLAEAQSRYGELRAELDAARSQPSRIAIILRYAGILLLAGGVLALFVKQGDKPTVV